MAPSYLTLSGLRITDEVGDLIETIRKQEGKLFQLESECTQS